MESKVDRRIAIICKQCIYTQDLQRKVKREKNPQIRPFRKARLVNLNIMLIKILPQKCLVEYMLSYDVCVLKRHRKVHFSFSFCVD